MKSLRRGMSYFKRDLHREFLLGKYLDDIYKKKGLEFIRNKDQELQHRGVDLIFEDDKGKNAYIDEKAQLSYLGYDLPTFTFEISYLKNGQKRLGWLYDQEKITTHYFLITGITPENINDLSLGFKSCKVTSVCRTSLLRELDSRGLNIDRISEYERKIREALQFGETVAKELDPKKEGVFHFSTHLDEKPLNLKFRLSFLQKFGKRIH